jgi:hypothetical protein
VLFARVVRAPELLDLPQDIVATMTRQAGLLAPLAILAALKEFTEARAALRDQIPGVPQLPIEVAFLRSALGTTAAQPAAENVAQVQAAASAPDQSPTPKPARSASAAPLAPAEPRQTESRAAETPRAAPEPQRPTSTGAGAPVPAGTPPAGSVPAENELRELVQAGWEKFLGLAGKRCGVKVQAALRGVGEIEVQGQVIVFLFQPSQGFSRDVVNQEENRVQVENVLAEQLGRRVQIRCALLGEGAAGDKGAGAKPRRKASHPGAPSSASSGASAQAAGGDGADSDETLLDDARRRGAVITPLKNEGKRA